MSKISPLAARRPWNGIPYHDAVPSSTNMPGTNGVERVGEDGAPPDADGGRDGGAAGTGGGAGVGAGSVAGGAGGGRGAVATGRRLAQPTTRSTARIEMKNRAESKMGSGRRFGTSLTPCTAVFTYAQRLPLPTSGRKLRRSFAAPPSGGLRLDPKLPT